MKKKYVSPNLGAVKVKRKIYKKYKSPDMAVSYRGKKFYESPSAVKKVRKKYNSPSANIVEKKVPISSRWNKLRSSTQTGVGITSLVFTILFAILLVCNLVRFSLGAENYPTLATFLEYLTEAPEVQIPYVNFDEWGIFKDEWAILDFLRGLLNFALQSFNVVLFFINGLVSVVTYVVYLFRWLFVV